MINKLYLIIILIISIIFIINYYFTEFFTPKIDIDPPEQEALEEPILQEISYNTKLGRHLRIAQQGPPKNDILYRCQKTVAPCGNSKPAGTDGRCTTNKGDNSDFNNCDKAFGTIGPDPNGNYGFWSPDDGMCYSNCTDPSGNEVKSIY
jgi:hypothetical protein